jgi:hypothetical protein
MSKIETNTIAPSTGTTLTLGESGDTVTLGSGATQSGLGTSIVNTWNNSSEINPTATATLTTMTNWSEYTTSPTANVGSSMTHSSGVWTFPETGIYEIRFAVQYTEYGNAYSGYVGAYILATTNNSSYNTQNANLSWLDGSAGGACHGLAITKSIIDVTDTANVKVKLGYNSQATTVIQAGDATSVTFTKIANT